MQNDYPQTKPVLRSISSSSETGFTLIEAVISIVIMGIVAFGTGSGFIQAVKLNAGNNDRTQAMTIAQLRLEEVRAVRFTPTVTDPVLSGGTRSPELVNSLNGRPFQIDITVDDDPFTTGIQPANSAANLKEITIVVTPLGSSEQWVKAFPVRLVTRRVRSVQ